MFLNAKRFEADNVAMAADKGISFLRLGADAGDGASTYEKAAVIKQHGIKVRYSLMKAYLLTPEAVSYTHLDVYKRQDQDRYTSVEKIERIARQMGLDYASGRRKLLESSMSELNRAIVKRTKRHAPARRDPRYEAMYSPDFDFVNYDSDSYDTDDDD